MTKEFRKLHDNEILKLSAESVSQSVSKCLRLSQIINYVAEVSNNNNNSSKVSDGMMQQYNATHTQLARECSNELGKRPVTQIMLIGLGLIGWPLFLQNERGT